ncbi:MAG: hypothetical protein KDN18_10685 [Verrucomicrobiae bacterium]|nr:hypothetical protein [Verrucomicrobiae bacterium]
MVATLFAEEPATGFSSLWRVPDLSPQLTGEEVSKVFTPWAERVKKGSVGWAPDSVAILSAARTELGSELTMVTGITLYSLYPVEGQNRQQTESRRTDDSEMTPTFHDYPILGQVKIADAAQANRWVDFLRDQIIPGGFFACDFKPRHGFRLSTTKGDIDILMCYSCDQLAFFGGSNIDQKHNPIFSSATKEILNHLFDKLEIKRDEPTKRRG